MKCATWLNSVDVVALAAAASAWQLFFLFLVFVLVKNHVTGYIQISVGSKQQPSYHRSRSQHTTVVRSVFARKFDELAVATPHAFAAATAAAAPRKAKPTPPPQQPRRQVSHVLMDLCSAGKIIKRKQILHIIAGCDDDEIRGAKRHFGQ